MGNLTFIDDILASLQWKMISLGTQGAIPKENQVRALHMYVDKMDANMAKPLLLQVYMSNAGQLLLPTSHQNASGSRNQHCSKHAGSNESQKASHVSVDVALQQTHDHLHVGN